MAEVRLKVGTAVLRGLKTGASCAEGVQDMVRRALDSIDLDKFPLRCALLFATADWCRKCKGLPHQVRDALENQGHVRPPLIGGSMAMLFCSTEAKPLIPEGLILVLLCSDDTRVSVRGMETPYEECLGDRADRLRELARDLGNEQEIRMGAASERFLFGILPGFFRDAGGNSRYCDGELHQEIVAAFDHRFALIGGSAADDLQPTTGYQFANDRMYESGLALAMVENGLSFGAALGHGLRPVNTRCLHVDRLANGADHGYDIAKLDGEPTAQRLNQLRNEGLTPHGRPILGLKSGADYQMLIPLPMSNQPHQDEFVRFNRKISRGDGLYVLDAKPSEMVEADKRLVDQARERAGVEQSELAAILVFSCVGRFREHETDPISWEDAARKMCDDSPDVPLVGALCSGEFGVDAWRESRANDLSVSVCCLGKVAAVQSRTGDLQSNLLEWADRLAACKVPKEVMKTALEGAVEAGATGGQICIVDDAIGRILGEGHGWAVSPAGAGHDWPMVLRETYRDVPEMIGGPFPQVLRDWSLPVRHGIALEWSDTRGSDEDILTLIVRTLRAVYVADPEDDEFQCEKVIFRAANMGAFLAIPLVGSAGKAIATMQLSLPDGELPDRDEFGSWVGYAQQVGAVLERAQETEERHIATSISAYGNELLQRPPVLEEGPHAWCDSFLFLIKSLLGADDAHIRLLQPGESRESGDEYRLVGSVGPLGELRKLTRPVTHEGEGSCDKRALSEGGYFTNTRGETSERNRVVKAIENVDEGGAEFAGRLADIESMALLPIYHRGDLLGSFVIDANKRYFFTERWQRIVRAAAETAAAVLCGRTAAYDNLILEQARDWQDRERDWMIDTMISATQGSANERLSDLLKRLCEQLDADVGSVYVWHEAADRLVLNTEYNWHEPKVGEASYKRNEGWTGTLAFGDKRVSFVNCDAGPREVGSKKYYDFMVPEQHRVPQEVPNPRIGVRLTAGNALVGVVTFEYYREHSDLLAKEDERFVAFLNAMTGLITLAVEAAKEECILMDVSRLRDTMDVVAEHLIAASQSGESWQNVMDDIRVGFNVERVTLYHFKERAIKHGWTSVREDGPPGDPMFGPVEPSGLLASLIAGRNAMSLTSPEPEEMPGWPNPEGAQYIFAQPVLDTQQTLHGVLEFVNRIPTREHPFGTFDRYETIEAAHTGQMLGAAIDHRNQIESALELRSQLLTALKIGASSLSGAIVMHRLLAPFGSIQRAVDWLEVFADSPREKRLQVLQDIRQACRDAGAVIHDAAQRGSVVQREESLRTIVSQAVNAIQSEVRGSQIRLIVENDTRALVEVNVFSIVGALVNVLSNALDAMGNEGTLKITTRLKNSGRRAVIRIHDTGPALTDEQIAAAFAIGASKKKKSDHLGLGLPLARRAVEDAGGELVMCSPPQGGVGVSITIPVAKTIRDSGPEGDST